jgi:phage baseplate assembly protein W
MRSDFTWPFRIDAVSGQAAQASYQDHVDQMIRQILLTDPGERVCMPAFGAGLRRLLFAPITADAQVGGSPVIGDPAQASVRLLVTQSLNVWLADQITVSTVTVDTALRDASVPEGTVLVTVSYVLLDTQSMRQTQVQVI